MATALLITESYPLGGLTEEAFVLPEIKALGEVFDKVVVAPVTRRGVAAADTMPANVIIATDIADSPDRDRKWLRPLLHPVAALRNRGDVKYSLAAAMTQKALERIMRRYNLTASDTVAEAFWFDFPSTALERIHRKHGLRYLIRAHGYDIYTDRAPELRRRAIASSDGLYAVSDAGVAILADKYADVAAKIHRHYLGVETEVSASRCSEPGSREVFILTVAQVIDRKRCGLCLEMAEALAKARPGWHITWTLIGDGPELPGLRAKVQEIRRDNLTVDLKGPLPHTQVMDYLAANTVDWLMLLSRHEGFGLVLAEAMAHGIPAIATDTGGIGESVDDNTGLLLARDPEPEEFVRGLMPYLDSRARYEALRQGARRAVEEKFDSRLLRREWAEMLKSLLP